MDLLSFSRSELMDIEVALKESIKKRKDYIIKHSESDIDGVQNELESMIEILKRIQTVKK